MPGECRCNTNLTCSSSYTSYFKNFCREMFLLFQIEAKGTLNGEKVEHQRTTFVKQLKLGKVSTHHTPCRLCSQGCPVSRCGHMALSGLSHAQLPQCLCIHLQRLSWSSHGAPLKRHEHVQFNEFLMMDIYKYHLLGHKPGQHSPKLNKTTGPALELQDGLAAPRSGGCWGVNAAEICSPEKRSWASMPSKPLCHEGEVCPVVA